MVIWMMNIVDKKTYLSVSPPEDKPATPIREPARWLSMSSPCESPVSAALNLHRQFMS